MYPAVLLADVLDIVVPYIPDNLQRELSNSVKRALRAQAAFLEKLQPQRNFSIRCSNRLELHRRRWHLRARG